MDTRGSSHTASTPFMGPSAATRNAAFTSSAVHFFCTWMQGLTLVHFSAQLKRIMWDGGAFRDCLGGVQQVCRRCQGVLRSIRGCSGCMLCQKLLRLS